MRNSSPPSVLSSIVKGGVLERLSTSRRVTSTSMSPVGSLGFLLLRSSTLPSTRITHSRPSSRMRPQSAASVSILNTNCVMP